MRSYYDRSCFAGLAGVAVLAAIAACDSSSPAQPEDDLMDQVRQATARYSDVAAADEAGYELEELCVAHPQLGGMGHHAVNGPLMDGTFDPLRPEVLLYEHGATGIRLTGVEYVVIAPAGADLDGAARPAFDDHPFDIGGVPPLMDQGVPHWSLHVWVHAPNPAGDFQPFNPDVGCGDAGVAHHAH